MVAGKIRDRLQGWIPCQQMLSPNDLKFFVLCMRLTELLSSPRTFVIIDVTIP